MKYFWIASIIIIYFGALMYLGNSLRRSMKKRSNRNKALEALWNADCQNSIGLQKYIDKLEAYATDYPEFVDQQHRAIQEVLTDVTRFPFIHPNYNENNSRIKQHKGYD